MDTTLLRSALITLNNMEVRGRDNAERLIGVMMTIEKVICMVEQAKQAEQPKPEVSNNG